ncbi:MAG: hypothetical protein QOK39_2123, partial [Acidimicrobiaceae bacterium]|nr:hypothetical protein [Acidimicrobiaceae bacterium]
MKKLIALGGIAAMGTFGFLGIGATVASAATGPTSRQKVCTQATNLVSGLAPIVAFDTAVFNQANSAAMSARALVAPDVTGYLTTANTVINDVDGTPLVTAAQQATDTAAFTAASNKVVADYVAASAADVALFNAQKTQTSDAFKS